ncbi:transcription factor HHO6-like [Phragmites australis]|uniref:transcription factor HHO6-like n=1 Tax=Phragmites australis TaxID=29695 RepID=UPI002D77FE5E|nr:transcription factor HHO6-like [Phragmites australis]
MTVLPPGPPEPATRTPPVSRYKHPNGSTHTAAAPPPFPPSESRQGIGPEAGSSAAAVMARKEDLRALAARAVTDSLKAAVSRSSAAERAARFEECVRSLEAEKAKMEVFRRELPISVHLIADVIEWLKEELAQHRRPAPELFVSASAAPAPAAKRKAPAEGVKAEADANDKRSWMSSAQLWSCGSHDSTSNSNGCSSKKPAHKVSNGFMPLSGLPLLTFARSSEDAEKPAAMPVPDLSLSSPAIDGACPAAPSATSSAVTDAGAQQQQTQRKARRCWSPELHCRFVAALQQLGGAQVATPKQIRELMKVDGLTNDEVKSHLQKYRLHTRRASSDGGDQQGAALWSAPEQQYTTSQHSTSQSGSPQGPLQLTVSSRAVSMTAGDSCDGDEGEEEEDGKSESYSWEMQQRRTRASSS